MGLSRGPRAGLSPRYLFVYGTLRRSFTNRHARHLAEQATWMGEARVPGRLYNLGRYPGLLPPCGSEDWVIGEHYRLPATGPLLEVLDRFEGPDFARVAVLAHRAGRRAVKVWVYEYRGPVSRVERIVSGDYLNRPNLP